MLLFLPFLLTGASLSLLPPRFGKGNDGFDVPLFFFLFPSSTCQITVFFPASASEVPPLNFPSTKILGSILSFSLFAM